MIKYLKLHNALLSPLLPSSLPLGRLVTNIHKPTQEFRDLTVDNHSPQTSTNLVYSFALDKKRKDSMCSPLISGRRTSRSNKTLIVSASEQKTYTLGDSEGLLSALSGDVKEWLFKKAWKFQNVYMVVGLCILTNSCVVESKAHASDIDIHFSNPMPWIPLGANAALDQSGFSQSLLSLFTQPSTASCTMFHCQMPGETVFAVQYRQVLCCRLSGLTGPPNIQIGHQWPNRNEWKVLLTRYWRFVSDNVIRTREGENQEPVHQAKPNPILRNTVPQKTAPESCS